MGRQLPGVTTEGKLFANHIRDGECWRWTGAHTRTGYGHLAAAGRRRAVHQLAYELWVGPIPAETEIDHKCRVRDCINPEHIEPVSHLENVKRAAARRTHCKASHEFTEDNVYLKVEGTRVRRVCIKCRRLRNRVYKARRKLRLAAISENGRADA